jgi:hypothetical protein
MLPSPRYEQVLAAILESAEEAIIGIALDGSIELWSRGAERCMDTQRRRAPAFRSYRCCPIQEGPSLQAVLEAAREGKMTDRETVERLHSGSELADHVALGGRDCSAPMYMWETW